MELCAVVGAQNLIISLDLFLGLSLADAQPGAFASQNIVGGAVGEAFLWMLAVQRVVNLHPLYGEVAVLAKRAVAKHLLGDVADFNVQAELAVQIMRQCRNQQVKQVGFFVFLGIHPLAVDVGLGEQIGWHHASPAAQCGQQVGTHVAVFVGGHGHIRPHSRCLLNDGEQRPAVEEVGLIEQGQVLAVRDDMYFKVVHAAKIVNVF